MGGGEPRIYINPYPKGADTGAEQKFKNVEFTTYYKRFGADGANWGGLIVGVRSGPMGHGSSGGDNCDATTYYARFRHDGKWDFEKELHHPESEYWSTEIHTHGTLFQGGTLPSDVWIGMTYLVYNVESDSKVQLELYIDTVSQGDSNIAPRWDKVGSVVDDGNWPVQNGGCSYPDSKIIIEGGGTVLVRNTDAAEAHYKKMRVREIDTELTEASKHTGTKIGLSVIPQYYWHRGRFILYKNRDISGRIFRKSTAPNPTKHIPPK